MIQELHTKEEFVEAVGRGSPIVITDSGHAARYHPSAQSCDHVTLGGFTEKVLANSARKGGYYAVGSRAEAESRWPSLSDCWTGWPVDRCGSRRAESWQRAGTYCAYPPNDTTIRATAAAAMTPADTKPNVVSYHPLPC